MLNAGDRGTESVGIAAGDTDEIKGGNSDRIDGSGIGQGEPEGGQPTG